MFLFEEVSEKPINLTSNKKSEKTINGILIAFAIISLWASSLIFLLSLDLSRVHPLWILFGVAWQMFLYTGLFITAHDAMHGVVFPQNHKVNNFIGSLAVSIYGLFDYKELLKKHWLHHHHPASDNDPDFHHNKHKNFFAWYSYFLKNYGSIKQYIRLSVTFYFLTYIVGISEKELILFWVVPSLLSSAQLFYFGTYLPHREPEGGYRNYHRAESNRLPIFWSFITCYHFGYHEEHHEYPHVPWWKLPEVFEQESALRSQKPECN